MWLANSTDLNPVDYHMMQERVYPVRIRDAWQKRLEARVHAEGGHFEHLLWCYLPDILVATHHICLFQSHQHLEENS